MWDAGTNIPLDATYHFVVQRSRMYSDGHCYCTKMYRELGIGLVYRWACRFRERAVFASWAGLAYWFYAMGSLVPVSGP